MENMLITVGGGGGGVGVGSEVAVVKQFVVLYSYFSIPGFLSNLILYLDLLLGFSWIKAP